MSSRTTRSKKEDSSNDTIKSRSKSKSKKILSNKEITVNSELLIDTPRILRNLHDEKVEMKRPTLDEIKASLPIKKTGLAKFYEDTYIYYEVTTGIYALQSREKSIYSI